MGPAANPETRPSPRFVVGLGLLATAFHLAVWAVVASAHGLSWSAFLSNWDSGWYNQIILDGYDGARYAFYPLYPVLVRGVATVTGLAAVPQVVGSLVSGVVFLGVCLLVARLLRTRDDARPWGLVPTTRLGWFLVAFSPASYVFHSHHTESLFLALSLGAFLACARRRWVVAAALAGLCALTKNQGIFAAVAVGVWAAAEQPGLWPRVRAFAVCGAVSGGLFLLYPLYQYVQTGDPLAFLHAQDTWRPEMTGGSYFRALWFGNAWQNTNLGSVLRYLCFWLMAGLAAFVFLRRNRFLGLYALLFVGVMPLSGEFVGTYRYGAVLFPVWYALGEIVGRLPRPARLAVTVVIVVGALYLNQQVTRNYALHRWAY